MYEKQPLQSENITAKSLNVRKRKISDSSNYSVIKIAKADLSTSNINEDSINSLGTTSDSLGTANEDDFKMNPLLHLSYKLLYKLCNLACNEKPKSESESQEYCAYTFTLSNVQIKFRVAKTTPTKVGQFVTIWKRVGNGPIMPCDLSDSTDIYIVCVQEGKNVGQFVFPKSALASQNVLSRSGKGGKRAIRVYAPWVRTESSQAHATKEWQNKYFINLTDPKKIDLEHVRKLYGFK